MKLSLLLIGFWALLTVASASSILTTKQNLAFNGTGTVKAVSETQVCVFCHTPHNGSREAPLWNRSSSGQTYAPYTSSTAQAHPGQPTGNSKLCLSCHDGTIALGLVHSRPAGIQMRNGVTTLPAGASQLGTQCTWASALPTLTFGKRSSVPPRMMSA